MKMKTYPANTTRVLVAAGVLAFAASSYGAGTTVGTTIAASANVNASCNVTAGALAFGTVDPMNSQVDASSTITVKCTRKTTYSVGLDAGTTTGATTADRMLANGTDTMHYNLYTTSGRGTVWGNVSGEWQTGTGSGLGSGNDLTVYGRVASGQQNLAVGSYTDTVNVTVTY